MPEHELGSAIPKVSCSRKHRQVLQVAPNVFGKLLHRCIPAMGSLRKRHQHDIVHIAAQVLFGHARLWPRSMCDLVLVWFLFLSNQPYWVSAARLRRRLD